MPRKPANSAKPVIASLYVLALLAIWAFPEIGYWFGFAPLPGFLLSDCGRRINAVYAATILAPAGLFFITSLTILIRYLLDKHNRRAAIILYSFLFVELALVIFVITSRPHCVPCSPNGYYYCLNK